MPLAILQITCYRNETLVGNLFANVFEQ